MPYNFLIVDDSKTVHGFIEKSLKMAGVTYENLFHAYNGQEGLEILALNQVDIVFSDIHMPVMDGIMMIEMMKKEPCLQTIPIIIISTEGSKVRIERIRRMGIAAFLRKPFTPEQLKYLLQSIIGE